MFARIAADARELAQKDKRIAELEKMLLDDQQALGRLADERDKARRMLRESEYERSVLQARLDAATSQGEGHEAGVSATTCGGSGTTQPEIASSGKSSAAAPSPAPIPLGATVERLENAINWLMGCEGEFVPSQDHSFPKAAYWWRSDFAKRAGLTYDSGRVVFTLPRVVADAATVERVAKAWYHADILRGGCQSWSEADDQTRDYYRTCAKIHARALGYTIQEGA